MRSRCGRIALAMAAMSVAFPVYAQPQPVQRSFYAEQREEVWYPDGQRDEDVIRITRLANRSFLAIHPLPSDTNRFVKTGDDFFYLVDTEQRVSYAGETDLHAAWPIYL